MIQRNVQDTVLLSGWLFADLLLGLMMIFLVSIQGAPHIPPVPPPTLTVTPSSLASDSPNCQGGVDNPQCMVTVGETQNSIGSIAWAVSNDMNDTVKYSLTQGTLNPGSTMQVNITALPCQNGSLIFSGTAGGNVATNTVRIPWQCKAKPIRLDTRAHRLTLTNVDFNGLLNNSPSAINGLEQQIRRLIPPKSSVGFAIVYDGAPTTNDIGTADSIDAKVYQALRDLGNHGFAFQNASYYDNNALYTLGPDHSNVSIDVFYFTR